MKYLMIAMVMFSVPAIAQESCDVREIKQDVNTPVPKSLEGATIIVKMRDGTTREMRAEEFKVVPRKQQFKVKEKIVTKQVACVACSTDVRDVRVESKIVKQKNIVSLELNRGLRDFEVDSQPGVTTITNKYMLGVGLMYQHNFYKDLYLGGRADTNRGMGINLGLGF